MSTSDSINLKMDIGIPPGDLVQLASDAFHEHLVEAQVFRTCLNCEKYDKQVDICTHYKAKPPAHVIVFSCKTSAYVKDVPF
jgi:hypothetical protein